jgi:hypothetical protein
VANIDVRSASLPELEDVIARGLETFVEVGGALMAIRDRRLYRETHSTFEAYCRDKWSMSRTHANRTIKAAVIAGELAPIGAIPANEAQARELGRISDDQIRENIWRWILTRDSKPTAALIHEVVEIELLGGEQVMGLVRDAIESIDRDLDCFDQVQSLLTFEELLAVREQIHEVGELASARRGPD